MEQNMNQNMNQNLNQNQSQSQEQAFPQQPPFAPQANLMQQNSSALQFNDAQFRETIQQLQQQYPQFQQNSQQTSTDHGNDTATIITLQVPVAVPVEVPVPVQVPVAVPVQIPVAVPVYVPVPVETENKNLSQEQLQAISQQQQQEQQQQEQQQEQQQDQPLSRDINTNAGEISKENEQPLQLEQEMKLKPTNNVDTPLETEKTLLQDKEKTIPLLSAQDQNRDTLNNFDNIDIPATPTQNLYTAPSINDNKADESRDSVELNVNNNDKSRDERDLTIKRDDYLPLSQSDNDANEKKDKVDSTSKNIENNDNIDLLESHKIEFGGDIFKTDMKKEEILESLPELSKETNKVNTDNDNNNNNTTVTTTNVDLMRDTTTRDDNNTNINAGAKESSNDNFIMAAGDTNANKEINNATLDIATSDSNTLSQPVINSRDEQLQASLLATPSQSELAPQINDAAA